MNILNTWLSEVRGRALWLSKKLKISASALSQMKTGRRSIPLDRMADFAKHTNGALGVAELLAEAIHIKTKLRKSRARANKLKQASL